MEIRPFVSPARILAGPGASTGSAAELLAAGVQPSAGPVLVVTDAAILELGLADFPLAALRDAGFAIDLRPPVAAEPGPDTVRALFPEGHGDGEPVAAVVAIGGGSAIDAGKLLALGLRNELDLERGLKPDAAVLPGPPLLAMPTTAGTGAEATAVAMLWHEDAKRMFVHPHLVPRLAVLDPRLLFDLPPTVTAAGGLDAISHAVESLLSAFRSPLTERAALTALELLGRTLLDAYAEGGPEAREGTLLGSFQAGLALNASVVLGHSLAYVISARTGLPHGVSCAMALPYCLAHARPAREAEIAEIAAVLCGEGAGGEELLGWLVEANAEMGIPPSLAAVGIDASALAEIARECVSSYPRPNHPVTIDVEGVRLLLEAFLDGDPLAAWSRSKALA